ncbi:MAG: PEGA domain-containing protein [bacterium]|nr:PEGA domain-containing protein [bacterium]
MTKLRIFLLILTLAFVFGVGWAVSLLARGYRFDSARLSFRPSGLLVITSNPDGAQILVNGELESATNATISLPPATYDVELKKDSFLPWKKRIEIKKEEVTKVEAVLFPGAPSLSALTFTGAEKPTLSPDGGKIAYAVPNGVVSPENKAGLWVIELGDLPIGFSRDPRQVTDANLQDATWVWSPDSRQILLTTQRGSFLLAGGSLTLQKDLVNIQGKKLDELLAEWEKETKKRLEGQLSRVPDKMKEILEMKAEDVVFSPDEKKVLYTATGGADIPENLASPLPGSSNQNQERDIKEGGKYIYDIKEDRNFLVADFQGIEASWFPTSSHVILAQKDKIAIADYDGTNQQTIWSAPYEAPYAIPFPNEERLLILTALGGQGTNSINLYALSLR